MSTRYKPELVDAAEDGALRAVLRNTFMPGKISLSFQREPNFFTAERAGNLESQVIGMRDMGSGALVGFGCRSFRKGFIDGKVSTIGYLSGLRSLPEVRGGTLLVRAYRYFKELHGDGKVPYYVTTIFDDNELAKASLTSGRAGLPVYHPLGRLMTYLLPLYGNRNGNQKDGERNIGYGALCSAVECINAFNAQHQFSPYYKPADFQGSTSLLPQFDPACFYVYRRDSQVTATIGVWDQNSFKQSIVARYAPWYRLMQPLSNIGAWMGLSAKLPGIGQNIPYLYASFLSHAPGYSDDLFRLIRQIKGEWSQRGFAYLLVGVHEKHPLASRLNEMSAMKLSSTVYVVYWEDSLQIALPSENRMPHLEIATL